MEFIMRWNENSNFCEGEIDNKLFSFSIDKHEKVPQTVKEIILASVNGKFEMLEVVDYNSEIDNELLALVIKYGGSYKSEECEIEVILNSEYFSIEYRKQDLSFYNSSEEGCYPREWISYAEAIGIMTGISNQNRNSTQSGRGIVGANSDYGQSGRIKDHGSFEKMIELKN